MLDLFKLLELEATMTLKSDLERLGQTILNSLFLTDMLMIGTLYLILLCQLPVQLNAFKNRLLNYLCT